MAQRPIGDRVRDVIHLKVPPGCESGVYHILVGNLPFEATWQMFKDHLRPVAEIDHVELFMSSTTGWVRVLGEDNFKRVLHFLDTVPFKDRAIMADGRNATNTIHIRHLVKVDGLSKKHKSQISPHQRAIQAYPKQMPLPPPVVGGPFYGGGQDAGYYMPTGSECESMSSMGYDDAMGGDPFAWSMPTPMYDPSGFAESSTNSFPPFNAFQYTPASYTFPYTPPSSVDQLSGYEDSGNAGNLAGPADSRKIIIKEIAYRAREEQIRTMVRDVAGAVRDEIETVTVPKYKNGSLKLIAYVLFCTPEAAEAGLMRFHGHDFMGRKLVAHLYVQRESGPSENGHAEPAVARSKGKGKDKEKEKDRDRKSNGKSYK